MGTVDRKLMRCSENRGEDTRWCALAVHAAMAAKTSEAMSVGHMQEEETGCIGWVPWKASVRLATEPEQMCK